MSILADKRALIRGPALSRLKINKGVDISVARLKCRRFERLFHFTSDSNRRNETVNYNWMSFWEIQALYIQLGQKGNKSRDWEQCAHLQLRNSKFPHVVYWRKELITLCQFEFIGSHLQIHPSLLAPS